MAARQSSKRGLVFVPNDNWPEDNDDWSTIEFVPMMWGGNNDTNFLGNVTAMMGAGRNISHVLTFNEPDMPFTSGGCDMKPAVAAQAWIKNVMPLREKHGVKVGLPVVGADADPHTWLGPFLKNCSALAKADCAFDFVPIHSYGDFDNLKGRVEMFAAAYPNIPVWITEYGYANQDLNTTQTFFNQSLAYLDSTDIVERIVSNVGPNGAFLDPYGNLTDIGSWYLGGNATGKVALPTDTYSNTSCTAANPCGKTSAATPHSPCLLPWLLAFLCTPLLYSLL
ncbi:glycosyl hydrolase catalytic core-domain-containing protein [Diplogelasinospora grovesii]|uniref:Glycosyl hydrolase catalytic core-domain-containing protein n=1 Tax=Diplogelasinospora grovesii TaxID=303347 RepID=A0AAN6MYM8_9PEZI|nr:glycosyl hydrolase catalytic core-domain-containing protein [Diplogelasinospora grovesii]